jgi:hypothetical protein
MDLQPSKKKTPVSLTPGAEGSILYHDIFDFPLTPGELIKWEVASEIYKREKKLAIEFRKGFYSLSKRSGVRLRRLLRSRASSVKKGIAQKASGLLRFIPSLKMVAITGALAMDNADEDADIDLLIITAEKTLWLTRLVTFFLLTIKRIPVRRFGDIRQKDKLCLNMWLDETNLAWPKKDRNIYTAHEIAQIMPLVNKDLYYERFLYQNRWIKRYWPNAARIIKPGKKKKTVGLEFWNLFERPARLAQYWYMKGKITREVVSGGKAVFHPNDWGGIVVPKLIKLGFSP